MENKLTDAELNKWAAEWLGVKTMHSNDERQHSYWIHNGVTHLRERWTPCADRNQAQMVVEKMLKMPATLGLVTPWDAFGIRVKKYAMDENGMWTTGSDLLRTPRQLVEAAYRAVNDGE